MNCSAESVPASSRDLKNIYFLVVFTSILSLVSILCIGHVTYKVVNLNSLMNLLSPILVLSEDAPEEKLEAAVLEAADDKQKLMYISMLNELGRSDYTIEFVEETKCSKEAIDFVGSAGWIQVTNRILDYPTDKAWNVMVHEVAHTYQFDNRNQLDNSEKFKTLFNSDLEHLADCMAVTKIGDTYRSGYNYECSSEQLTYAANTWESKF